MRKRAVLAALVLALASLTETVARAQRQPTASGNARGVANAIVGRVVNPNGAPVPGTFVTLLKPSVSRWDQSNHISMVSALLGVNTNERGEFRLENLPPGPYYPVAFPQNLRPGSPVQVTRAGYAVTYYPNLTRLAEAQPVVLTEASTITANFTLSPSQLYVVSGALVGPAGQPWRGERLGVSHAANLFGLDSKGISIQPDGRFAVPNLPNGSYCLTLRLAASTRDAVPTVFGTQVTVDGRDIANVRVARINMVSARGRLVVDPADRARLQPSSMRVAVAPITTGCNPAGPQRAGTVRDDLTFEFQTWPGPGVVYVSRQTLGDVAASVRLNGADVTKTSIDFRDGTEITGLEIDIRAGATPR